MKRCMYCGHENDDASETCAKCGNHLIDTPAADEGMPIEDVPDTPFRETVPEGGVPEVEDVALDDDYPDEGPENAGGRTYPESGQYDDYDESDYPPQQYGGRDYDYEDDGSDQYGGQAYGYDDPRSYPDTDHRPVSGYDRGAATGSALLMKKARKRMRNPFLFLGILFYSIHFVAQVVYVVLGHSIDNLSIMYNTILKFTGKNVATEFMSIVINAVKSLNVSHRLYVMGAGLAFLFPALLIVIGLWAAFGATSNRKKEISTGGYTCVRVGLVLRLIMVCVVLLASIAFAVVFVVRQVTAMSEGTSSSAVELIAGVIGLLILILAAVFVILYYVQAMYAVKVVRTNAKSGTEIGKIPGFAVLVNFIGCLFTVGTMVLMAPDDYIGLAAKGSYAVWLLLTVFWALIYRASVRVKRSA